MAIGFESHLRFLEIAKGSVGEIRNQFYTALAVNYIT